jgi:hypothetical protein
VIQRIQQDHLIPVVSNIQVFAEHLSITIIHAVTYPIDEDQPPFGILGPNPSDFQRLFFYAQLDVLLRLLKYKTSSIVVAAATWHEEFGVGSARAQQPKLNAVSDRDGNPTIT